MSIVLGARSLARLDGVHPDLVRVVKRAAAISAIDFTVLEGLRSLERQKQLLASGATRTMKSRHLNGHAVDLGVMVGKEVRWDWPMYIALAKVLQQAAAQENIPIRWGGSWKLLSSTPDISAKVLSRTFPDGPHYELPVGAYP